MAAPLAVSLMLLAGAGHIVQFLTKSYLRNRSVHIDNLIGMSFRLNLQGYDESRAALFQQQLSSRLEKIPGVSSVALTHHFPLAQADLNATAIRVEGSDTPPNERPPHTAYNTVSPNYFATIGVPIVQGRGFTREDSSVAPPVVLVNESMVRKFFPTEDPLGRRFRLGTGSNYFQVIGVVKDIWDTSLGLPQPPLAYVSNLQAQAFRQTAQLKFLIRTEGGPEVLRKRVLPAVRGEAMALDSKLKILIGPLSEVAESDLRPVRLMAVLSSTLGSLAMLLAAVGIYGVMAYTVSQRTQEIAVRMSLGAQKTDILRLVLGGSVTLIAIGIVLGLGGSLALSRVLGAVVANTGGLTAPALVIVSALLASVAMLASYLPARRAMKVDPMTALRYE